MVQPDIQSSHLDSMDEADKPEPDSPLFTFASVSAELLKYFACETVPTIVQGMSFERKISSVDLKIPSKELSLPQDPK